MKLVIDIPDQIYKEMTETAIIITEAYPLTIDRALTESTPYEERETGKWILDSALNNRCSVCNCITTDISVTKPPFCQWCGAKMEVEDENNS